MICNALTSASNKNLTPTELDPVTFFARAHLGNACIKLHYILLRTYVI
jgi:hypothetical protein